MCSEISLAFLGSKPVIDVPNFHGIPFASYLGFSLRRCYPQEWSSMFVVSTHPMMLHNEAARSMELPDFSSLDLSNKGEPTSPSFTRNKVKSQCQRVLACKDGYCLPCPLAQRLVYRWVVFGEKPPNFALQIGHPGIPDHTRWSSGRGAVVSDRGKTDGLY
jgi:hypothetical protein